MQQLAEEVTFFPIEQPVFDDPQIYFRPLPFRKNVWENSTIEYDSTIAIAAYTRYTRLRPIKK